MEHLGAWSRSEDFAHTDVGCIARAADDCVVQGIVDLGTMVDKHRRQFAGW